MSPDNEDAIRRKRLHYRAWHRGMKEMDLILGRFADARLSALTGQELAEFEIIIACPDVSLYSWITGREAVPAEFDGPVLREILKLAVRR